MKGALSRSLFSLVALPALILAGALAAASGPDSKAGVRGAHMLDNMLVPKRKLTKVARRKRKVLTKKLEKLRICSGVPGRDVKLWKIPYC